MTKVYYQGIYSEQYLLESEQHFTESCRADVVLVLLAYFWSGLCGHTITVTLRFQIWIDKC